MSQLGIYPWTTDAPHLEPLTGIYLTGLSLNNNTKQANKRGISFSLVN